MLRIRLRRSRGSARTVVGPFGRQRPPRLGRIAVEYKRRQPAMIGHSTMVYIRCSMKFKETAVLAAAILAGSGSAYADQPKLAVVAVRYLVTEQSPERLEKAVMNPLERILVALPRVSEVNSTAGHGFVNFEIQFGGGASEQDLKTVIRRVEELALGSAIVVTSCTVNLASPR